MPNGKPGDHAYTDVAIHGMSVFGSVIDGLIRRIDETGGLDEELWTLLMDNDPRIGDTSCDYAFVEAKLRQILERRQGNA
jgi:hypothetical protein